MRVGILNAQNQVEGSVVQGLGGALFEAIDFAVANESKSPRNLELAHYQTFGREPTVAAAKQAARAASTVPPSLKLAPALKDVRGRALPPDVNRMVAEMQRTPSSEQ